MKSFTHSIRFKIWRNQLGTLLLFILILIIANMTILETVKSQFTYEQLEHAAKEKFYQDNTSSPLEKNNKNNWIPHFAIDWSGQTPELIISPTTSSMYLEASDDNVLTLITQDIGGRFDHIVNGKIHYELSIIHYVAYPLKNNSSMIFFDVSPSRGFFRREYIFIALLLSLLGFFTSSIVSKKISRPIKDLEGFASEIAKRNWSASVPKSNIIEIVKLTHSLDQMKSALNELEVRDRKFLQSASHDLKTPVMIIKGYAQAMNDGINVHSDQTIAEVFLNESEKLERRITQLLRLNTIGHALEHDDQRDYIRLDRLLKNLVNKFSVVAPNITWVYEAEPFEIIGDANALLIAFENILENQIRYAKTTIVIHCNAKDKHLIQISNDGPPFETKNTDQLFDPYQKESDGNFGLGLAIVRQVIEGHQGQVSAHSTDNGVCFRISL